MPRGVKATVCSCALDIGAAGAGFVLVSAIGGGVVGADLAGGALFFAGFDGVVPAADVDFAAGLAGLGAAR